MSFLLDCHNNVGGSYVTCGSKGQKNTFFWGNEKSVLTKNSSCNDSQSANHFISACRSHLFHFEIDKPNKTRKNNLLTTYSTRYQISPSEKPISNPTCITSQTHPTNSAFTLALLSPQAHSWTSQYNIYIYIYIVNRSPPATHLWS